MNTNAIHTHNRSHDDDICDHSTGVYGDDSFYTWLCVLGWLRCVYVYCVYKISFSWDKTHIAYLWRRWRFFSRYARKIPKKLTYTHTHTFCSHLRSPLPSLLSVSPFCSHRIHSAHSNEYIRFSFRFFYSSFTQATHEAFIQCEICTHSRSAHFCKRINYRKCNWGVSVKWHQKKLK